MRVSRLIPALAIVVAMVVGLASPAAAHGGGGSDATNYQSRVTSAPDGGLRWEVLAGDALLQLHNGSDRDVVVLGYSGEPYLRFAGTGGVFENRRSAATYLNRDRYGATTLPADIDSQAEPSWSKVSDGRGHAWHDHRIHWMSRVAPPQVQASDGGVVEVNRWNVPYRLGDQNAQVTGVLRWVPAPPWWPWPLGALFLLGGGVLAVLSARRGRLSIPLLARTGALLLGVVMAVDTLHLFDDLVAVPASMAENVVAGLTGAVYLLVGMAAVWAAYRSRASAIAPVAGAMALFLGFGLSHAAVLASSQLATTLPDWFSRAVVGANLALIVPIGVLAVIGERRFPRVRVEPAEDAASPEG